MKIPFNKPYLQGKELTYITDAVVCGKISGDGVFSKKCQEFFQTKYQFYRTFLTTSCSDALEMSALLLNIGPDDEVILPSFTFASTANAFALRGAKLVFADSSPESPNIDTESIRDLITPRTKAIVVVHYAGMACNMEEIMALAQRHQIHVIEDAAQAIDSFYKGKPLGSFGTLAAFSFHETKNIISGEGGLLVVNHSEYVKRAEIIREKGTNRSAFFRGEIDKYDWVDLGSSFLPSELNAAYLFAQLEFMQNIQQKRIYIWNKYMQTLGPILQKYQVGIPIIPDGGTNNGHLFYLVCRSLEERQNLIQYLNRRRIMSAYHYQSLHKSTYYLGRHDGRVLKNSDRFSDCLLRLPLYFELEDQQIDWIVSSVIDFYKSI